MLIMNRQGLHKEIEKKIEDYLSQKMIIVKNVRDDALSFLEDNEDVDTDFNVRELSRNLSEYFLDEFLSRYIYKYQLNFAEKGCWMNQNNNRIVEDNLLKGMPIIIPD